MLLSKTRLIGIKKIFYKWMEKRKAKSRDNHKWQKPSSEHRHIHRDSNMSKYSLKFYVASSTEMGKFAIIRVKNAQFRFMFKFRSALRRALCPSTLHILMCIFLFSFRLSTLPETQRISSCHSTVCTDSMDARTNLATSAIGL